MLVSAVLVALVGVLMKRSDDKLVFRALLSVSSAVIVFPFIFIVPFPPDGAWPYLLAGAFAHFFYQVCYVGAFERGDMSLVYPIMRGVAPAITAIVAFVFLNEALTPTEVFGLCIVVAALIGFGWPDSTTNKMEWTAIFMAVICGVFIALYSVIDAAGMRISQVILDQAWTYIIWFFLLDMIGMSILALYKRQDEFLSSSLIQFRPAFVAGTLSLFSFSLALYAFTLAPVAKMSAMRETSVLFGAVFAALLLKERFGGRRIVLAAIMVFGLLILQK